MSRRGDIATAVLIAGLSTLASRLADWLVETLRERARAAREQREEDDQ